LDKEQTDVIAGCKRGDRRSQEILYRNYYRAMISVCLWYTKNEEDAVEVLNNGFLKVFKNISRYDPVKGSVFTWIRKIIVNSCLDFVKQNERIEQHQELTEAMEIPAQKISIMKTAELLAMVRCLPRATAAVFNLYEIEGYSHREIGEMLAISEGTSKWHLSEAKKKLREKLTSEYRSA
jgi:RNA polymerase sigma factor (sigma-70 family)